MPKIPQYNRKQFQSSYIGGPQVDRSGEALAGSIAKAGGAIIDVEAKKAHARQQNIIDQQANNNVIQGGVMLQETARRIQQENSDTPEKASRLFMEEAAVQMGTMGEGIGNEQVRVRTLAGMNSWVKQAGVAMVNWGFAKQEENATIATANSLDLTLKMAGTVGTPEGLANNISGIKSTLDLAKQIPAAQRKKLFQEYAISAATASLNYRLWNDEDITSLTKDIEGGEYDNLEYMTDEGKHAQIPFPPAMKDKFLKAARSAATTRQANVRWKKIVQSTGEVNDAAQAYYNGDIDGSALADMRYAMQSDPDTTNKQMEAMDALVQTAFVEEKNAYVSDDFAKGEVTIAWQKLYDKIEAGGEDFQMKTAIDDLLDLQIMIDKGVANHRIDRKFAGSVRKNLVPFTLQAIAGTREARTIPAFLGLQDNFSAGVVAIKNKADNSTAQAGTQGRLKASAVTRYYKKMTDATNKGKTLSLEDHREMALTAYNETLNSLFPGVSGAMTKDTANAMLNQSNSIPVHGNATDLKTGKSIGKASGTSDGAKRIVGVEEQTYNAETRQWVVSGYVD